MCSIHVGIYFPQQYFVSPMTQIDNRISADDDEIIKRKMCWHSIPFDAVRVDHICNSQVPLKDQLNHFNRHEKAQHKIYWHHQSHYNFWQSQLIIAKVFKKTSSSGSIWIPPAGGQNTHVSLTISRVGSSTFFYDGMAQECNKRITWRETNSSITCRIKRFSFQQKSSYKCQPTFVGKRDQFAKLFL